MIHNKRKRGGEPDRRWLYFAAAVSALVIITVIAIVLFSFIRKPKQQIPEPPTAEEDIGEDAKEQASIPEEKSEPKPPDYDFTIEEVTIPVKGLTDSRDFAWVSDLHMITDHEPGPGMDGLYLEDINKRYEVLAVDKNGMHAEDLWPILVDKLNFMDVDGIIFGGDLIDYCSESNVKALKDGLDRLEAPWLYIRSDHDMGVWYGGAVFLDRHAKKLHKSIDGNDITEKNWEFDDFIMVGVDYSTKDMPKDQMWMLEEQFNSKKAVIVMTHVPYASEVDESLKELSLKVRNTEYYWGGEHYQPNDNTEEYLHMIYRDNSVVSQVLAGHLHASWDGMLTQTVPEHIFGPAFEGHIGLIHVVPG